MDPPGKPTKESFIPSGWFMDPQGAHVFWEGDGVPTQYM